MNKGKTDPALDHWANGLEKFAESYGVSTLTRDPSAVGIGKLIRKIDMLAEQEIGRIHELTAIAVANGQAAPFACQKGCAHCCYQMVATTIPEVLVIADSLRASLSDEELNGVMDRLQIYSDANADVPLDKKLGRVAKCPLLVDEVCSIFEVRPLACRGFNSSDVEACKEFKKAPGTVRIPHSIAQSLAASKLRDGIQDSLEKVGLGHLLFEFAEALLIALRIPDAADRYLVGERLFDGAACAGQPI